MLIYTDHCLFSGFVFSLLSTAVNKGNQVSIVKDKENIPKKLVKYSISSSRYWKYLLMIFFYCLLLAITWGFERSGQTILFVENNTLSFQVIPF